MAEQLATEQQQLEKDEHSSAPVLEEETELVAPSKSPFQDSWLEKLTRLTLQKKYSLSFSLVFLIVLFYIIISLFSTEEEELLRLSNQNFETIFQTVNTIGAEAMSVGGQDKLALRTVVKELFNTKSSGLERVFFASADKKYVVYADKFGQEFEDTDVPDSLWASLEKASDQRIEFGNSVYLTKKILYPTAQDTVFLGYSQLAFSLESINKLVDKRRRETVTFGLIGLGASLVFITLLTAVLIRRIKVLNDATKAVTEGIFNQLPVSGNDELAELTRSFNAMTVAVRERLLMSRYVSRSTVGAIRGKNLNQLSLGGNKEKICVLFTDVRGFTTFSEQHEPSEVVEHLNQLLDLQVRIIRQYMGDVDKFVGDEIMAVFRGPAKEQRAVAAALAIQRKLRIIYNEAQTLAQLHIGIGINTGEAVTGNIGTQERMDFTAIGDMVNTGSRLCSVAKPGEILVSESVREVLPKDSVQFSSPFSLLLKNKQYAVTIYRIEYE